MRHLFEIEGTEHLLWLARLRDRYWLDLDGTTLPVALTPLGDDRYRLRTGDRETEITLIVDGDAVHIALDGVAYALRYRDNAVHFGEELGGGGEDVARAPMPGSVVAVTVAAGQEVKAGDALMVIESMKLETTIRAWRAGIVATIHISPGQSFERDAPLLSLAPQEPPHA